MKRLRQLAILSLVFAWGAGTAVHANGVLEQVPRDALGALVVRNLSETDAKIGKVLGAVGSRLPGPLALLKSIAGLDAGIDSHRDLLVVLLPPQSNSRQYHLAVWLPVRDYEALVRSLDGDPGRRIATVTLAGEDLLIVQQDNWAVMMDTDQRDRLEQLGDDRRSPPPQVAEWSEWIETNDAAIVVLPAGMRAAWAWAAAEGLLQTPTPSPAVAPAPHDDDLFGSANRSLPSFGWPALRQSFRGALAMAPELKRWAAEVEGFACGLRLDDDGNTLIGVRGALPPQVLATVAAETSSQPSSSAPRLYSGGAFVTAGHGRVTPNWIKPLVARYVRLQANELMAEYEGQLSPDDLSNLCQSAELAAADVSAFSVLTRPGTDGDGVYGNNFLALRVGSSETFLDTAGKLVQEWNAMVGKVDAMKPLAFDSRSITVADQRGREYAIDMVVAAGGPPLPEVKAAIEKLFGPGGKFRVQVVPIDETTVLLAAATESQVAEVINVAKSHASSAPAPAELQATTPLFTANGQWRLYFSPRGYASWLRRRWDAEFGDAIGAPMIPEYPKSPPIGVTVGIDKQVVWTEFALPIETLRGFAKFSRK